MLKVNHYFKKIFYLENSNTKKLIFGIIILKLILLVIIGIAYNLSEFQSGNYYDNFLANPNKQISIIDAYSTWDAQHYIYLSENGYQQNSIRNDGVVIPNHVSNAFYPAFPYAMQIVNYIVRNPVISGLLLSNIASLLAFIYFYKFVKENFDENKAIWSILFLAAFPTSFYYSLVYTESFFLLFTVLFFLFLFRSNYKYASIAALILPLVRPNGILIIIPFIFHFLYSKYLKHKFEIKKYFDMKILYLGSPLIGILIYFVIMQIAVGDFKMGYRAQSFYLADNSIRNILNPIQWFINNFINVKWVLHDYQNSIMDRLFLIGYLILLIPIYKLKQKTLFIFAIVFGLIPALSGTLSSFTRYLIIVFPVFIVLGTFKDKWLKYILLTLSMMLQITLLVLHSLNYWVA